MQGLSVPDMHSPSMQKSPAVQNIPSSQGPVTGVFTQSATGGAPVMLHASIVHSLSSSQSDGSQHSKQASWIGQQIWPEVGQTRGAVPTQTPI
jgi:hypothetical protein